MGLKAVLGETCIDLMPDKCTLRNLAKDACTYLEFKAVADLRRGA